MKKLLLLSITALLLSVNAFAQSSYSTLKGDVNDDGKVDVADINAVISIMKKGDAGYFYLGTTQPTAENFKTLSHVVALYTSIDKMSGAKVLINAGETLYMLCPTSWMEEKKVELKDKSGNLFQFLEDYDAVTIPGYTIYKTQVWNNAAILFLTVTTVEYAYSGWASSVEDIDIHDGEKITISNNKFTTAAGENYFVWFAIPVEKSVKTVENTRFSGDFIEDVIVQLSNQTVDGDVYKMYYHEFIGRPSDNRYNVTIE